ncbi:MAG: hypothetical protein U0169_26600 [Polyangiaceae bacterium]
MTFRVPVSAPRSVRFGAFLLCIGGLSGCAGGRPSEVGESAAAQTGATVIVNASPIRSGTNVGKVTLTGGFYDSRFSYDDADDVAKSVAARAHCYVGTQKGACTAVKDAVRAIQDEYSNGSHDTIEDLDCDTSVPDRLAVTYRMVSDYDSGNDLVATRQITACSADPTSILEAYVGDDGRAVVDAKTSEWARESTKASFCYVGTPAEVCKKVDVLSASLSADHAATGSNFFENLTCTEAAGEAKLAYDLVVGRSRDVGGAPGRTVPTQRTLAKCPSSD